jgi:hypothetical protein
VDHVPDHDPIRYGSSSSYRSLNPDPSKAKGRAPANAERVTRS